MKKLSFLLCLAACLLPQIGFADAAPVKIDAGDTAWMLVSTAFVLMMLIPGLALFYGGMVSKENVLGVLAQSFIICCVVSVLWVAYGYSFAFTAGKTAFLGGDSRLLLHGLTLKSVSGLAGTIPESVYIMFQLTFAAITCALILGAVATRIKFASMLLFIVLWFTFVYIPIAHWVWGDHGWLGGVGIDGYQGLLGLGATLDYAGGTVVHINAGIAGLMAAIVLGKGYDFKNRRRNTPPYNIGWSLVGAAMLWVGWFGFNAGSAVTSGDRAGMAMLVTHVATAAAAIGWMVVEWLHFKKPTVLGIISGAVAGLVAITPACGFVDVGGALWIGVIAGVCCYSCTQIKYKLGFDDTLDVFAVHCVGGIIGAILTGVFAVEAIGGVKGALEGNMKQVLAQCLSVGITIGYCAIVSYILLRIVKAVMGLAMSDTDQRIGLDQSQHGEMIYG
ncbi:MAG TPA: ammonium transporter [Rickettsiales bacterium]|nr:ammonium transporter [Rickettsiales bacterium]